MNKDLKRRLGKLEKQAQGALKSIFFIVHYKEDGVEIKPIAYSREQGGPQVRQKPGETHEDFQQRAITELFGERAKDPGIHALYGINDSPDPTSS